MIGRLNQDWRARDYTFDVILWENFVDAMSKDGLQKEYNRAGRPAAKLYAGDRAPF